jgi:hypothetical protein
MIPSGPRTEPSRVDVLVALQFADELSAAGSQAGVDGADVFDGECDRRSLDSAVRKYSSSAGDGTSDCARGARTPSGSRQDQTWSQLRLPEWRVAGLYALAGVVGRI